MPNQPAHPDYLKKILAARVYDVAKETRLDLAAILSERINNLVYLKREDMQSVFSFKLRGAYNKMANLSADQLDRGVVCASAGNHAQGVALAGQQLGCKTLIVMPTTTPPVKYEAVQRRGAEVVFHGMSYSDAYEHAKLLERERNMTFVHPFDDPDVIAGQGTIALEILHQHSQPIDAIFVAIGGGGMIAGISAFVKRVRPEIKVIGVQTVDSNGMEQSLRAGKRIALTDVGLFSDGTAVKMVGAENFRLCQKYVDEIVLVTTDEVCAAIKDVFIDTRTVLEPAGALSVAGAKFYVKRESCTDKTLIAVTCGANINFDRLRYVAERADVGLSREALYAVTIPEGQGQLMAFVDLFGSRTITEFNCRRSISSSAHVFVGVQISNAVDVDMIREKFDSKGFASIDLTHDELAKDHIRHLCGGKADLMTNEVCYRVEFPERPGGLARFLLKIANEWEILLVHYRNHGGDVSRVLLSVALPSGDADQFTNVLRTTAGCRFWDETDNPAFKLFCK